MTDPTTARVNITTVIDIDLRETEDNRRTTRLSERDIQRALQDATTQDAIRLTVNRYSPVWLNLNCIPIGVRVQVNADSAHTAREWEAKLVEAHIQ
jgi:hypothetical protein